ncbi:hypothetical protein DL769_001214 [Monosporascus sp. CRB-8-3]|nr:hypothetical protein DL769_001214 [Monosporascus sp. CRB-8-3]
MFHDKFVHKLEWIDEQAYRELLSISTALTGSAGVKMLYGLNFIHDGVFGGILGFLLFSLPGALGMYGLALVVSNIDSTLPQPVYALLTGLNAATVGVIAQAAVQLSGKAITDKLTRILLILSAAAGLLYTALWYFPVLIAVAGITTVIYDFRCLHRAVAFVAKSFKRHRGAPAQDNVESQSPTESGSSTIVDDQATQDQSREQSLDFPRSGLETPTPEPSCVASNPDRDEPEAIPLEHRLKTSWKTGLLIVGLFFASFLAVIVSRAVLIGNGDFLLFRLFANLYLAGTIIFGGGAVVIPLLREYIVAEGWVTTRDFLIGLAVIQTFPGPGFNFAVFLGAMTAVSAGYSALMGAAIAFVAIFTPGLVICHGTMGLWSAMRGAEMVKSVLRGFNAAAIGFIYTGVYKLWKIGYMSAASAHGASLSNGPWWVVIAVMSYSLIFWFGLRPPFAIVLGGIMGLIRYAIVYGVPSES